MKKPSRKQTVDDPPPSFEYSPEPVLPVFSLRKRLSKEEIRVRKKVKQIEKLLDSISVNKDLNDQQRISSFLEACRVLLERGFELEVERHVGAFLWERQQRGDQAFVPVREGQNGENPYVLVPELKWWCSLIDWAMCELQGREEGLKRIPGLLLLDDAFFIGQPWVQKHILYWYEQGEAGKIHQLFFGSPKQGNTNTFRSKKRLYIRDMLVVAEVDRLNTGKGLYNKAIQQACKNLKKRDILLKKGTIQSIYDKYREGYSPFSSLGILF